MTASIHLIKLSVGPENLVELADWQSGRLRAMKRCRQKPELMHITRQMPKRAEELIQGGSIYWVIKGWLVARQQILELRPVIKNDIPHCGIIYDPTLMMVHMRPRRPFQGWRYFDPADAPKDIAAYDGAHSIPDSLERELIVLGLA